MKLGQLSQITQDIHAAMLRIQKREDVYGAAMEEIAVEVYSEAKKKTLVWYYVQALVAAGLVKVLDRKLGRYVAVEDGQSD